MATITPTVVRVTDGGVKGVYLATWTSIGDSDTCSPVLMSGAADRSVAITGTFNSATVVLQGSHDATNYFTLTDPQGNAISKTAAGLEQIEELTRYIRPSSSGGTASVTTVNVLLKGQP